VGRRLPARLTVEQVAWVLNCQPHDVPILVAARLLKPLGSPPPNSVKFLKGSVHENVTFPPDTVRRGEGLKAGLLHPPTNDY
jgi:hypothetical protein